MEPDIYRPCPEMVGPGLQKSVNAGELAKSGAI
jgi:hypothetical protein